MKTSTFFNPYYNKAKVNSIMIMSSEGVILDVNEAFTKNFGYSNKSIQGKNFSILFNEGDRANKLPQLELQNLAAYGQADDENYVVSKNGLEVWTIGESMSVTGGDGVNYIVKDIVNLQTTTQMKFFLNNTEELLERIFESKDIAIMVLNSSMKIIKANGAFIQLFEISIPPLAGSRLSDLNHPFWVNAEIKKEISNIIVNNQPLRQREFLLETRLGEKKKLKFDSQTIDSKAGTGRKFFLMIDQ
jgi:PAS domain S-box-containing protein